MTPMPSDDLGDDGPDIGTAIRQLAGAIAAAHRRIVAVAAVMVIGFAVIGAAIAINGHNAVNAETDAEEAKEDIGTAKVEATEEAKREAVKVAEDTRTTIRRQTRREAQTIVRREIGRRGLRGRPPTPAEVDAAVARYAPAVAAPTAAQVAEAIVACLNAGGCGVVRGPPGAAGADGDDGADAAPITPEMIDAAVARHCMDKGCGTPGPKGEKGEDGAPGLEGPPPKPATVRFVVHGMIVTCTIDFTVGPDPVQPCTAEPDTPVTDTPPDPPPVETPPGN